MTWDGVARTLKVERNFNKDFTPIPVEKDTTHKPGTFKCKYVYTDIKTYMGGQLVESFAISGVTLMDFELLLKYGKLNWNGTTREIRLTLDKPAAGTDPGGDTSGDTGLKFTPALIHTKVDIDPAIYQKLVEQKVTPGGGSAARLQTLF